MAATREPTLTYYRRSHQRKHSYCVYDNILYDKDMLLGEGSFGSVYRFVSRDKTKQAVVKAEKPYNGIYDAAFEFSNCAYFAKSLYGIGAFYGDITCVQTPHYVFMPYIEGETLDKLVFTNARQMLHCFLAVLLHLHEWQKHQIVHGDIKENNIKIQENNGQYTANLIDFDLTRKQGTATRPFFHKKSAHLAPELGKSAPAHPNQDIYSVGKMFQRIHAQHTSKHTNFLPPDLECALQSLYNSMTANDPNLRPTVDSLLMPLKSLIDMESKPDNPAPPLLSSSAYLSFFSEKQQTPSANPLQPIMQESISDKMKQLSLSDKDANTPH